MNGKVCTCTRLVRDPAYRYGTRHEAGCPIPSVKHRPVSEAFRRQELAAHLVAISQQARWALPVESAIEAERLARRGADGLNAGHLLEDVIGIPISGDHRPALQHLFGGLWLRIRQAKR